MKTMDTAAIEATVHNALETLNPQELPARVDSWIVKVGLDSTEDPAVWVWVILRDENVDFSTRSQLRERVEEFVQNAVKDDANWVYVRFRTAMEQKELEENIKREEFEELDES